MQDLTPIEKHLLAQLIRSQVGILMSISGKLLSDKPAQPVEQKEGEHADPVESK